MQLDRLLEDPPPAEGPAISLVVEPELRGKGRSSDRYRQLKAKHNERALRAPHAQLDGERAALEITRAAGCVEDTEAHLIFNGSLGSTDQAFVDGLVLQLASHRRTGRGRSASLRFCACCRSGDR